MNEITRQKEFSETPEHTSRSKVGSLIIKFGTAVTTAMIILGIGCGDGQKINSDNTPNLDDTTLSDGTTFKTTQEGDSITLEIINGTTTITISNLLKEELEEARNLHDLDSAKEFASRLAQPRRIDAFALARKAYRQDPRLNLTIK